MALHLKFLLQPGCRILLALACAFYAYTVGAQTPRDFAIDLRATLSTNIPRITLSWTQRQQSKIAAQKVYRRVKNTTGDVWELQATLTTDATTYADATALSGVEYEYWMQRTFSGLWPSPAVGYLSAGAEVPMTEARGTLLLVVDNTMVTSLAQEITQLQNDLAGDGWTVKTFTALRSDTAANVKAQIKSAYAADPTNVKMVYLLGHVPVPYSGNIAPDGHGDHVGAWPADGYYGDMDGNWTDTSVSNTAASRTNNDNIPGDGKFDQGNLPSEEELMVGRVDLHSMTRAPTAAATETMLLRRYLRKAHDFRHKQGAYAAIPRRSVIRDGFGYFSGEAFAISGWSWIFSSVGLTVDEAPNGQWFSPSYAGGKDYLVGYANGVGSYDNAGTVGNTVDFGLRPSRAVFTSLFGSYFGDWDSANNFLRAPLAGNATTNSLGLTSFWGGRPARFMHHLGMGETVGFATMMSHNSHFWGVAYQPNSYSGVHCGLMGDPALRLHMVEPPRNLTAFSANAQIVLSWSVSTETNLQGYFVYRAATPAGPFTRLNADPIMTPMWTDTSVNADTNYTYLVRTLKLETAPGGTYYNLSIGSPITVTARSSATASPRNPTTLAVTQSSAISATLTWTDSADDETGFRVERKTNGNGSFAVIGTVGVDTTSFSDTGPFSHGNVYYYRVVATNASGDSPYTPEAAFEATAGHFDLPATRLKVDKSVGSAIMTVNRFGGLTGAVSVNYATSDTTASAGTHYMATSGTLIWPDGDTSPKTITVPIINTAHPQPAKQFKVTLSGNSSNTGITINNVTAVLIEDASATLASPWNQIILGSITDSSPASLIDNAFSSVTIGGSGATANSTSENGQFVYQSRSGDGTITVYLPSGLPSDGTARVALMIRASTSPNAIMAASVASSSSAFGSRLAYRVSAGASAAVLPTAANTILQPVWLRLTRAGSTFTAEASTDGISWTVLGATLIPNMPTAALWGIFHYSSDWSPTSLGNYHLSTAQNITFVDLPLPAAPTGVTVTSVSSSAIAISWDSVAGAGGYRIERRTETNGFVQLVDLAPAIGNTQSYIDSALASDTAFAYRITAYNTSGNSAFSTTVYATTPLPNVITTLSTDGTNNVADAAVQRDLSTTPLGTKPVVTTAGYYYSDGTTWTTLTNASKIYLRFNLAGIGAISAAQLKLTFADAQLFENYGYYNISAYLLSEASDVWDEGAITWANAPQNNTSYYNFTGTVLSLGYLYGEALPTAGETVSMSLNPANLFSGRGANNLVTLGLCQDEGASMVWASREHDTYAAPTLELTIPNPLPSRPAFLTASQGWGWSVELQWHDSATTQTGYELERSENGGEYVTLQNLANTSTEFLDASTRPDTTYTYRIRAVNATGGSSWSQVAVLTTPGFFHASGTLWDAEGSDTMFNTPANWDRNVTPPFDGSAYLNFAAQGTLATVNTEIRLAGLSLHASNDFAIVSGGAGLRLGAGGLRAACPDNGTSHCYTVSADITLTADQTWGVTNQGTSIASLVISGSVSSAENAYGLTKAGDGPLTLASDNTYAGNTVVADHGLRVTHGNALGSTNGNTVVNNGAWLEIAGGIAVAEPLVLDGTATIGSAASLRSTCGTNIWNGPIAQTTVSRVSASSGSSLTLAGGVTGPNIYLTPEANARLAVSGLPLKIGSGKVYAHGPGVVAFSATNNIWNTLDIGGAIVRADAPDVLPATSIVLMGNGSVSLAATLDLNGHDQTVGQLKRGSTSSGKRLVTSATPATLTVNQTSGSYYYDGDLGGALSFVKSGAGTLYLIGTNNTFTGSLVVSNGNLNLSASTSLGQSESILVAGGQLKLLAPSSIVDTATLSIAEGAKVNLAAGQIETVGQLVLSGGRKWKGTWGATGSGAENTDDVHFLGTGKISVPTGTSTVWDGGGATTGFNTPFNWDYDDLPLLDGSAILSFGIAGTTATVNTNVGLRGIVLNRDADFTIARGDGMLTLGPDGLLAGVPADTAHTYTIAADLSLATNQTWHVTNTASAATAVIISGSLHDRGNSSTLTKTGDGCLSLAGDNREFNGDILIQSNSVLRVGHSQGLGGTEGVTTILSSGKLEVCGDVTISEPLTLNGDTSGPAGALYAVSGTNTWRGAISQTKPSRIGATGGATLVLSAPVSGGDLYISPDAGSCVMIAGSPLLLGARTVYAYGSGTLAIGVAGNTWSTLQVAGMALRTDVPNALPPTSVLTMGGTYDLDATVDLNGNDQTVVQLRRGLTTYGNRLVTSEKPATFTINYTGSSYYYDGVFGGAVRLVKNGAGTLNLIGTNNTFSGSVVVSNGVLSLGVNTRLGKSEQVTIAGGQLKLLAESSIADTAALSISDGGKLNIGAGLVESVKTLRLDGVLMRRGTYGASGSGASVQDDTHFAGTGQLNVLRGTESFISIR